MTIFTIIIPKHIWCMNKQGEFGVLPWLFILLPLRKSVFSPAVQGISMMKINTRNGILP